MNRLKAIDPTNPPDCRWDTATPSDLTCWINVCSWGRKKHMAYTEREEAFGSTFVLTTVQYALGPTKTWHYVDKAKRSHKTHFRRDTKGKTKQ